MASITTTKLFNLAYTANQEIRSFFSGFFSPFIFKAYVSANLLIISSVWLVAYMINLKTKSDGFISLNYNVDFGVNLIGPAEIIYKLPLIGLLVLALNLVIAGSIYKKNIFSAHILLISSALADAVLLVSIIMVYFINFR